MNNSTTFYNLSIHLDELPNFKQAELTPIAKTYQRLLWFNLFLLLVVFSAIPILLYFIVDEIPQFVLYIIASVFFIILFLRAIEISKGFPKRKFGVRELDVIFQKGYFFFKETVIPFKRIQHVEIKQGPALRILNLYSLKLYTAGAATGDLVIDGLSLEVAEKLKAKVLQVTEDEDE